MGKSKTAAVATAAAPAAAHAEANGFGGKKTVCPIGRAAFREAAKPVTVVIAGTTLAATPKEFSTGSLGYYAQGKVVIEVGGVPVTFQVGLNLAAVGSKDLPK